MIQAEEIILEQVDSMRKELIDNLWQYYELESSFYNLTDVDISGRFTSLNSFLERVDRQDTFEWGYIIKYNGHIAGLLIIGDEYIHGEAVKEFSDIYILPKYRGCGIASHIIRTTILNSDHAWLICVFRKDEKGLAFWRNAFVRLPFDSVVENIPSEIDDLHEFIINKR